MNRGLSFWTASYLFAVLATLAICARLAVAIVRGERGRFRWFRLLLIVDGVYLFLLWFR